MKNKVVKIGIIGPRCFVLGGHDANNPSRKALKQRIEKVLLDEQNKGNTVLGLTGLDIGTEQDFAAVCNDNNIEYYHYIAYANMDYVWDDIDYAKKLYESLAANALSTIVLNDGEYSPKKINMKNKRIISDSDILIYVRNPLHTTICSALKYAQDIKKDIRIIEIQERINDVL